MIEPDRWGRLASALGRSYCQPASQQCWHRHGHEALSTSAQRSQTSGAWQYHRQLEHRQHHGSNCNVNMTTYRQHKHNLH